MEGRRVRRFGRWRSNQTLLPVRVNRLSNAVSCWYCDCKSSILNEPLFGFGRKYSRLQVFEHQLADSIESAFHIRRIAYYHLVLPLSLHFNSEFCHLRRWSSSSPIQIQLWFLKTWFSMGVGFSLAVLFAVTMGEYQTTLDLKAVGANRRTVDGPTVRPVNRRLASERGFWGLDPRTRTTARGLTYALSSPDVRIVNVTYGSYFPPWIGRLQKTQQISGLTISVADIGYLCMSSFISVSVHELGHALAAARCISHAALINETSGARKSEAQSGKWKLKGQESDPGSPATYFGA
uniref:Protease m50 membrane-bound transcription factor site 2 protease n=1 Tax=Solanum tuberosum TaxID=4113 RepID=M1BEW8_SOLTU